MESYFPLTYEESSKVSLSESSGSYKDSFQLIDVGRQLRTGGFHDMEECFEQCIAGMGDVNENKVSPFGTSKGSKSSISYSDTTSEDEVWGGIAMFGSSKGSKASTSKSDSSFDEAANKKAMIGFSKGSKVSMSKGGGNFDDGMNGKAKFGSSKGSKSPSGMNVFKPPTGGKLKKPSCCKGGVSVLKLQYLGDESKTFFLPTHKSIDDFIIFDSCNSKSSRKGKDQSSFVFADCNQCFPTESNENASSCDPTNDVYESITLDHTQIFCLISFDDGVPLYDTKLPTDVTLYYQEADDDTSVSPINIHTSCSQPIYPPFALQLEVCPHDRRLSINIEEDRSVNRKLEDAIPIRPSFLNFLDGISAKFPGARLSNCDSSKSREIHNCCKGGASFLKTKFAGTERSGFLTFKKSVASLFSECVEDDGDPCDVRFVSCADSCHTNPFAQEDSCSQPFDVMDVDPGDEVCFGLWDDDSGCIAYDRKMPTNFPIYFVPSSGDVSSVFTGIIHTSCSKPLYIPFAQALDDACFSSDPPIINLKEKEGGDVPIHLAFRDGISKSYYNAACALNAHSTPHYNISFAACGCNCNGDSQSSDDEWWWILFGNGAPEEPTTSPELSPSGEPSLAPSASNKPSSCSDACTAFVYDNCVFSDGTGDACDIESGDNRLLLQDDDPLIQADTAAGERASMLSSTEKREFHRDMVTLYAELNTLLDE